MNEFETVIWMLLPPVLTSQPVVHKQYQPVPQVKHVQMSSRLNNTSCILTVYLPII